MTATDASISSLCTSATDLKFLHRLRQTHFRNFKSKSGTRIIYLLVPLLLPKFVSEGAAIYPELRKRGTSAADLKFLHRLRQTHFRNFKSKSGTRIIYLLVPLLLPKFVSEGAAMYHELRKRGTTIGPGSNASGHGCGFMLRIVTLHEAQCRAKRPIWMKPCR